MNGRRSGSDHYRTLEYEITAAPQSPRGGAEGGSPCSTVLFSKFSLLFGLALLAAVAGGCNKKVASTPPAPPPAPALQPTVTLNASPSSVNSGQTVTLSWSSTNATDLDIEPGVGKVAPQGSTPVNPTESTTLHNYCHGRGRKRHGKRQRKREWVSGSPDSHGSETRNRVWAISSTKTLRTHISSSTNPIFATTPAPR